MPPAMRALQNPKQRRQLTSETHRVAHGNLKTLSRVANTLGLWDATLFEAYGRQRMGRYHLNAIRNFKTRGVGIHNKR